MSFRGFLLSLLLLAGLVGLLYGGLRWLHVETGQLADWAAGVAILWWFAVVLTLPWNAHFAALGVVEQARDADAHGVAVPADTVAYAQRVARRFRQLAIGLHLVTAAGLLVLAYYRVVPLGYWAAGTALALTLVRPAERAYEHLAARLRNLGEQIRYPRQDVAELRARLDVVESNQLALDHALDTDRADSWAATQTQAIAQQRKALDRLDGRLEELIRQNARDHEALARQGATEIARLSEDARFLNQARELIRFWKGA